jgi:antitoxin MazE
LPTATVGRWGRSLAVRIPGDLASAAGLDEGQRVDVEVLDGAVVIRRASRPLTLKEMFQGKTPVEWRAAYAGAYDWGPDLGREAVEE